MFFQRCLKRILANLIKYCRIINICLQIFQYVIGRHSERSVKNIISFNRISITIFKIFPCHKFGAKVQILDFIVHNCAF